MPSPRGFPDGDFYFMKTNLVRLSHDTARQFLAGVPRVCAIDATVGNGGDTLFLAELASASGGRVFGFDVQAAALERARARLAERSLSAELFLAGHEKMAELLPPELAGKFACAFFNLGWLPRSDKSTITRPETTLAAMDSAVGLLDKSRGLLSALCYRGHEGGAEEFAAVRGFFDANFGDGYESFSDIENAVSPVLLVKKFCGEK